MKKIVKLGFEREANESIISAELKRTFQGFLTTKIDGKNDEQLLSYKNTYHNYTNSNIHNIVLQTISRVTIESSGYALLAIIPLVAIFFGLFDQFDFASFGLVMISFLRLLPSLNRIISGFNVINFSLPSLELIRKYLEIRPAKKYNETINEFEYLDADKISVSYNHVTVFKNFNIKIEKGSVVVISGPSGSGKTTLLERLIGLVPPIV